MSSKKTFLVDSVGVFTPKRKAIDALTPGDGGYVIAGIKDIDGARVGDTITLDRDRAETALSGFETILPKVFAGMYPISSDDYEAFREALQIL